MSLAVTTRRAASVQAALLSPQTTKRRPRPASCSQMTGSIPEPSWSSLLLTARKTLCLGLIDAKLSSGDRTRQMRYASLHMTRPAQLWYFRLELNTGAPSWCSFVKLVHTFFGPPMTDSPLGELKLLHRTSTVEDYCDRLMALACRDHELSEDQQVQLFVAGLRNPLQIDVALRSPRTMNEAIKLARAYEQHQAISDPPPSRPRSTFRPGASTAPTGMAASSPALLGPSPHTSDVCRVLDTGSPSPHSQRDVPAPRCGPLL